MPSTDYEERDLAVLAERRAGRTLASLAREYGVCPESIRQIALRAERIERKRKPVRPCDELSPRTYNAMTNYLSPYEPTPEAVATRFPDLYSLTRVVNLGRKSIAELQEWLVRHGQQARK